MPDDKPYKLTLVTRKLYVYAHVKADFINDKIVAAYLSEAVEACRQAGRDRLLIYRDIPEMLPDGKLRIAISDFDQMIGDIRTAAVNPYLSASEIENVVGTFPQSATFRVFANFKDAEAWLLS